MTHFIMTVEKVMNEYIHKPNEVIDIWKSLYLSDEDEGYINWASWLVNILFISI